MAVSAQGDGTAVSGWRPSLLCRCLWSAGPAQSGRTNGRDVDSLGVDDVFGWAELTAEAGLESFTVSQLSRRLPCSGRLRAV